ncbi:MAG: YceI family protein [Azospirillaceae bacterium]
MSRAFPRLVPATAGALALAASATALAPATAVAESQAFAFDKSHTHILFFVDHLGFSAVQGEFLDYEGELTLDTEDPANSSVAVTIDVASLDSGHPPRDEHLLDADFFDAEAYPEMTFASTRVEPTGEDTALVHGDLTIKGVTRPVVLDTRLNGLGPNPFAPDQTIAGFSATTEIARSDFGMDFGLPAIGDTVEIRIEIEASPLAEE